MDIGPILNTMRDPAGIPADPTLFQALAVFTWIFHIAFVHLALGTATLAIAAFYRRDQNPHWSRLSWAMTKVAKVSVSLLIVLGVAPLLFTQVIYDPLWYTSNVLSARWAIGFIFTLIVAYCLWFAFYWSNHEGAKRHIGRYAVVALALLVLDGLIMHALSYQALLPDRWMDWYAPNGVVDTSGAKLHAIQWPRFAFIISLAAPAVGLFLLAYADYFSPREDYEPAYLAFVRELGARIARWSLPVCVLLGGWWIWILPKALNLLTHPVAWLLLATLLSLAVWLWLWRVQAVQGRGYALTTAGFAVLGLLAILREVIRVAYLAPFGYHIADYKVHTDWPSLVLFTSTLLGVGGLVGSFFLTTLYRAGRVRGLYTADVTVSRMGSGAVAVLGVWILIFFAYGIAIWLRNSF